MIMMVVSIDVGPACCASGFIGINEDVDDVVVADLVVLVVVGVMVEEAAALG